MSQASEKSLPQNAPQVTVRRRELEVLLSELKTSRRAVYSVGGINGGSDKAGLGSVCDPAVLNGLTLVEGDRGTEIEAIERELNRR